MNVIFIVLLFVLLNQYSCMLSNTQGNIEHFKGKSRSRSPKRRFRNKLKRRMRRKYENKYRQLLKDRYHDYYGGFYYYPTNNYGLRKKWWDPAWNNNNWSHNWYYNYYNPWEWFWGPAFTSAKNLCEAGM